MPGDRETRQERFRGLLAHDADIHPTYLSGIERGVRNPTWTKFCALAGALKIPVSGLAREAEVEAQLAARVRKAHAELGIAGPTNGRLG